MWTLSEENLQKWWNRIQILFPMNQGRATWQGKIKDKNHEKNYLRCRKFIFSVVTKKQTTFLSDRRILIKICWQMNAANYFKDQRRFLIRISTVSAEDDLPVTTYRASHIMLDYLQALTPKYVHIIRKTWYFLQENLYIFLMINLLKFLISPKNRNLRL